MAALGITVLKNNVPWGPFTRAQIEDGLGRGDFTVQYLAHAPGLKEWLPLGEVLDYFDRHGGALAPSLPPIPGPVPASPVAAAVESRPADLPQAGARVPERPSPPALPPAER